MKRISKQIKIIAIILALLMIFEVPVSALQNVIDTDQSSFEYDISNELDEADSAGSNILGEIEEERDEYSKTFRLENGNKSLVEYSVPIHYQDEQGNWLNYDNTLKEDKRVVIKQQDKKPESTSETRITKPSVSETTTDSDASESVSPETTNTATFEKDTENQAVSIEIKEAESPATEESILPTEEISTYSTKNSSINISYSKQSSENNMVFVGEDNIVSWGYKDINSVSAKCVEDTTEYEGNEKYTVLKNLISTVKYDSVYKDVDMELISTSLGVKENIILNSKNAANSFISEYEIGKLSPKQLDDRVIALFNDKDEVEYYINAEYMYDAQGEVDYGLKLTIIEESNGKLIVELTADDEWLSDSERAFPVTIDPTFITGQQWNSVQCTYINSYYPNTAYGYGSSTGYTGTVYTGTYGYGMNRTLLKMNNLPSLNKGDMIIDVTANLYLYNGYINSTGFFEDEYVGIYEVKESWSQSTVTWNSRPNFYSPLIDYVKFDESSEPGWFSMNITKAAKRWFQNPDTNYGIMLKSVDEDSCRQCAAYFSSNYPSSATPRPAFQITYRNNKGIENYWTNTTVGAGGAGTLYVNDYSGALTFIAPIASTASPAKSAGISYVYNSYMAGKKDTTYKPYTGKGWRMNIHQTLLPSSEFGLTGESAEKYPYVFTDSDGTDHYFYKKTENGTTKYIDEDGLDLELKINTNNQLNLDSADRYVIIDKDKNKLTFFSDGLLRTQRDAYDNIVRQYYTAPNTITTLRDASGNDITFETNSNSYAKKIKYPGNREVSIGHATFGELEACICRFTREDGTHSDFTYYDNNGLLKSVQDADGYKVVIYYDNTSTKKVAKIEEYGTDGTLGNTITFDRSKYNTTVMQSSGNDGVFNNSDDIITTYQFDNCGRTKSVQTKTKGNEDLGAANYEYTSGTPNSSGSNIYKINRISSEHAVGANTYNYVKNHGFEAGSGWTNSSWLGSNTFTGSSTTEQKAYGQKSYKIKSTAYNNYSAGRAYQDITGLESGSTYTLSGYVKVTELSGNQSVSGAVIAATSFNNDSTTQDYYSETITEVTDTAVNDGWRRVSVTFTVPSNSNKIRVNIALKAVTGTAYFDGIQLEKAETAGSYNLLENSSFEKYNSSWKPTSWEDSVGLTYSTTNLSEYDGCRTSQQNHGSASLKILGDTTANKYLGQIVPVSGAEDDTYIASGWAKADSVAIDSENIRKFKISIAVNYSDGTQKFKESADFNETISDWQFVSKAFNLSDGTSTNKTPVSIEVFATYSKQGNAAYFDNFSLVKEPSQSYTYDSKGNLVSVVSNAQQNSSMEYNTDNKLTKVLDPKGYSYKYTYNDQGSVKTATTQNGAKYTYEYDSHGNVKSAVGLGSDGVRVRSRQTISYPGSSSSEYTVTSYDQRDQASVSTYNSKTGTLKSFKDPKNVVTSYSYNSDNDLLTSVSKDNHTVSYSYESNYRNLTGIDTATTDYSFTYDAFGARTQTDVGNRTLATYTYNNGGLLTKMDYGNGNSVKYEYDKYGNVSKKSQKTPDATEYVPTYEGITDNTGTITKAIDHVNNLQYDYTYDSTDRLISSTVTNSNNNQRKAMFEYNFDANNNMSKFITLTPTGHNKVLYTYGKDNLLTGMTLNNQKTLDFVYDGIGRPTSHTVNLIHPLTTAYTYHGITSGGTVYKNSLIRTEKIGNGDFWYLYHYDANNNINRLYQNAENEDNKVLLEDYSYDALNQLENVNYYDRHERHEYTYDNGGNITEEKVYDTSGSTPVLSATNTYTYSDNSWGDLLTGYNGDTITYDEIGNPLNYRDGITFTWSNGRQLQSYTKNNSTINYTYDSSGMRLSKDVGNTHYTYLYQNGLLVQETIGEKILDYSYTSGGQILSVRFKANANDSGVYYYYALNGRGDVVGLYDHTGALYAKYTYDVWGNPVSVTNANDTEITSPTDFANIQPLRYRSCYYDSDTGFYYLQSRYYDPVTHRFINADGLVSTGTGVLGYNMFAYCENNPLCYSDTSGCLLTTHSMQEGLASGKPQSYNIMDVTLMMYFGCEANTEFSYDTLNWARSHSYYVPYINNYREITYKALALINCIEFDGDIGFGFGAEGNLAGAFKLSCLAKTSLCVHVDYYGPQTGMIDSADVSLGIAPWDLSLIDETSFWTSDGQYFHETNTSPKPSISFGGYFIIGGSLTWSWSEQQYYKILNEFTGGY